MSGVVSKAKMVRRAEVRGSSLMPDTSLPDGWKWLELRSVCLETNMVDPSRDPERAFRYVDVSAVSNEVWQIQGFAEYTGATAPSRARKQVKADDAIFATIRPTLRRVAMVPASLDGEVVSTAFCVLRADPAKADPKFVYYSVLADGFIDRVGSLQHGASYPAVSDGEVLQQGIAIPPLAEQQAIADVLAKLQRALQTQNTIVSTLRELKAATMGKLFREGLRGEPLKPTEIGEIPESWNVVRIGDHGGISSGGTPSRDRPEYWNGSIPWVKTGEIDYHPILKTEERITEAGLASSSARLFPKGTLLMAMYGQGVTRGKVAFLEIEAATNQACAALFPDEKLDSGYLYSYCAFAYERIRELGHGANQKNLSADLIRAMPVPLPPSVEEQKEIYSAVKGIDSRLFAAETRLDRLRALFASTLRQLMSGQVRVPLSVSSVDDTVKWQEAIGSFVATLVEQYQPDRLTMFGPPVAGSPRAFGDVGLLVEMPFRGLARDQAARIDREIPHDFSLDLLVRRPEELRRAREIGDRYLGGILERGRVLYARPPGAPARQPAEAEAKAPRRPLQVLSEETIEEIVRRIVEAAAPEQIVLFGSAARGEMGPDSDVDLLVVKACTDRRAVAQTIRKHLVGVARGLPKDIIVVTPDDVERDRDTIGYIIRPALREGRVVYAA